MKKILFISTRNPYSGRYSGDVIGSKKILNTLKKKNIIDLVSLDKKENFTKKNVFIFKSPFLLTKIFYVLRSLVTLKPLHFGLFYSNKMKRFVKKNVSNYDQIFCYHIRSTQYVPKNFKGKKIIEMGDLYSSNYRQTYHYLNFFNPLKYIYLLESLLVKKIEKSIFSNFDKIILFSKSEIKKINKQFIKKIVHIDVSIDEIKNKYLFSKKNKKILFIGNLKYLPNILAVKNFVKKILPKLQTEIPHIKLQIIGDINLIDKILLTTNKNVECLGKQKNLDRFIKGAFCGLANLEIATGIQGKILTYMSYGLPVICSKKVATNFNKNVMYYKNYHEFINKISILNKNHKVSRQMSKKSLIFVNNFKWKKISQNYLKVVGS
jgi:glycosyltransferase involved in cell wall biosynthesis